MDSERLEYVTRRYPQLQGRLLPLAPLFMLSAAWRAGLFHVPGEDQAHVPARWFVLGLAVAVAVSYPVGRWYEKRFGTVSQPLTKSPVLPMVAVIACLSLAMWIQGMVRWPFSLPAALLGMAMGAVGVRQYPLRRHYLVAAVVFVGFALLPAFGVAAHVRGILFDVAIAVALVIVGVGDHLLLTTTLHEVHADV
jgi:hypothetical protein